MRKPRRLSNIRNTRPDDFDQIIDLCKAVYRVAPPWGKDQLQSHLNVFAKGQIVAEDPRTGRILGMSASLIVLWDDYDVNDNWKDFTDHGYFTNHDPAGRTLYGAEVMVHPDSQGMGVGKQIYAMRRQIVRDHRLLRIRAGARLRGYSRFKDQMSPEQYVIDVVNGRIGDPTLTFQIKQGFRVLGVVHDYLHADDESCGHAALIEWINHQVATRKDYWRRSPQFARKRKPTMSSVTPPPPAANADSSAL